MGRDLTVSQRSLLCKIFDVKFTKESLIFYVLNLFLFDEERIEMQSWSDF